MIRKICDRCGKTMEGVITDNRVYTIKGIEIEDLCDSCYTEIIKFIEKEE